MVVAYTSTDRLRVWSAVHPRHADALNCGAAACEAARVTLAPPDSAFHHVTMDVLDGVVGVNAIEGLPDDAEADMASDGLRGDHRSHSMSSAIGAGVRDARLSTPLAASVRGARAADGIGIG